MRRLGGDPTRIPWTRETETPVAHEQVDSSDDTRQDEEHEEETCYPVGTFASTIARAVTVPADDPVQDCAEQDGEGGQHRRGGREDDRVVDSAPDRPWDEHGGGGRDREHG